jgi:hypothetical protein
MRRGYYGWDEAELPLAALAARRARLQAAMAGARLDGLAFYTNIARPAAVSWLTGFTPYWSEGLLFVGPEGEPEFATALSKRVAEWMRAVTPVGALLTTPRPAEYFAKRLASAGGPRRLGVLELDMLPGGQATEILAAAPNVELVDATELFRAARLQRDDAERGLFAHGAVIAREALALIDSSASRDAFALVGAVEKSARDARAEDVQVTLAPDLARDAFCVRVDRARDTGDSFAIRASIAYKSTWVRRARSISTNPALASRFAALEGALDTLIAGRDPAKPIGAALAKAIQGVADASLKSWTLEDCRGSYPLESIASDETGDAIAAPCSILTVHATVNGVNWIASRPL